MKPTVRARPPWPRLAAWLGLLWLLGACLAAPAHAQAEQPLRLARVADWQGTLWWFDTEQGEWATAARNGALRPFGQGDRLATDADGRAELRIGSTVLRLGSRTEIEFTQLDDEALRVLLVEGSLSLAVRNETVARQSAIVTDEAVFSPERRGLYRVDRQPRGERSFAAAISGELRAEGPGTAFPIEPGRRFELWVEGPDSRARLQLREAPWAADGFADWVAAAERREPVVVSTDGGWAEDFDAVTALDRHGRWDFHPEHGRVWLPAGAVAGWAPYRHGRWAWVRPGGWIWVDAAPWAFITFQFGRWEPWGPRWAWVPGWHRPPLPVHGVPGWHRPPPVYHPPPHRYRPPPGWHRPPPSWQRTPSHRPPASVQPRYENPRGERLPGQIRPGFQVHGGAVPHDPRARPMPPGMGTHVGPGANDPVDRRPRWDPARPPGQTPRYADGPPAPMQPPAPMRPAVPPRVAMPTAPVQQAAPVQPPRAPQAQAPTPATATRDAAVSEPRGRPDARFEGQRQTGGAPEGRARPGPVPMRP